MSSCVLIPVHKPIPTAVERFSLEKATRILSSEEFLLVAPKGLNTRAYKYIFDASEISAGFLFFNTDYFSSRFAYNKLLLSNQFYEALSNFEYILLFQTDSLVLKNELKFWVEKNYDYIGAPWVKTENGSIAFDGVGNGGFSLRKVHSCLDILKTNRRIRVKNIPQLLKEKRGFLNPFKKTGTLPSVLLKSMGYKNRLDYYLQENKKKEDVFWGTIAPLVNPSFKVPEPEIALKFAFERESQWCFGQNNRKLPFGVHAWEKYDKIFWQKIIQDLPGYD